MRKYNTAVSEG